MNGQVQNRQRKNLIRTILIGGGVGGALDGIAAALQFIIITGRNPVRVFQYIASGVFGVEAFASEWMAVWGVLFHFCIATGWAALFLIAFRKYERVRKHPYISGLLYGPLVWLIMSQVVLPLSNVQVPAFSIERALVAILILSLCIGLPLSVIARMRLGKEMDGARKTANG
jgi:hypothetical protein